MASDPSPLLLDGTPVDSLDAHRARGGMAALAAARSTEPEVLIDLVADSGLRGRGGAGFPTGTKWRSVARAEGRHRYAVANAAEGEPGTFKDRALIRHNPYRVVEGLAIAAHAVGAIEAYIACKASFGRERELLERAVSEMGPELGVPVRVVTGPEEYLFGEEKALLEVIEGRDPLPRWLPPYLHGLFATAPQLGWEAQSGAPGHRGAHEANPTLVNNVETLANVPGIVLGGAEWFRRRGTAASPGTVCATVVGDVAAPGVYEVDMGTPLREVLDRAGGCTTEGGPKAVFSGVANPVITADDLDVPLCYDAMEAAGTGLGAAGFIVYGRDTCMVRVAAMMSRFLYVESCGQCPPCKLGSAAITEALERIDRGEGTDGDLDIIAERLRIVTDGNRCYLPVQEQRVVASILRRFPEEVAEHLEQQRCPLPRDLPVPKIVDIVDGTVVWDERQASKRPDWTYGD